MWQGVREHRGWSWVGAGVVADGFRPDRWDLTGAVIALAGVGLIMFAPR